MDIEVTVFILAILIIAVLIFVAILLTGKRGYHFNVDYYQTKFLEIGNKLDSENPATYMTTVIEADKLLDKALMEMGAPGKTMGERLKKSSGLFTNPNAVWRAHKLRNVIAHESNAKVSYKQAQNALAIYKQALKDIKAI